MLLTTAALIGSAALSGAGALGSALATARARKAEQENYDARRQTLLGDMYESPLDSISNRALLTQMEEAVRKSTAAADNRAAAGGATFENTLAAKDAANKTIGNVYGSILRNEDTRRRQIQNQLLNLDARHSQTVQNNYLQSAGNWAQWGANMGGGLMDWGGTFDSGTLLRDAFAQ